MADPDMLAQVLTALVQGTAGEAGKRALAALGDLARRIPFLRDSALPDATGDVGPEFSDPEYIEALAGMMTRHARTDPDFGTDLDSRLADAQQILAPAHGGIVNMVSGDVGTLVQAHDIHGGVSIGDPPRHPQ